MKKVRKFISLTLAFLLVFSMLPASSFPVFADTSGSESIDNMNALAALGIDTSKMPEGYDPNSQDNPYGRDTMTINPVQELFTASRVTESVQEGETTVKKYFQPAVLKGHNGILTGTADAFYSDTYNTTNMLKQIAKNDSNKLDDEYVAFDAASGNFNGSGMKGQVVTVAASAYSPNGGIYMYFTDPLTGNTSSSIELLSKNKIIGNAGKYNGEDFASQPYQLQNYLQIATGDFDGDGMDEVAVYVPEQGNSRLSIYKLQTSSISDDDLYLDSTKWTLAWTYAFNEAPYVSNMVSVTSGDFNEDGTDDLALTWGTYYGPGYNTSCKASVLYGDKYGKMLQTSKAINLSYSNSDIVRAAFTYGDIDGNQTDELILGGQLVSDINNKVTSTRVIMMYSYDGKNDRFILNYANNFKVIEDKDKNGRYPAGEDGLYWSTPACVVNIAAVKMDGLGKAASIYLDSVLYKYGNNGLEIMTGGELDQLPGMSDARVGENGTRHPYYAEYGIVAGDFDGDGKETIQVIQYFLPYSKTYSFSSGWWFWEKNWTETDVLEGRFVMHSIFASNNALNFKSKIYEKYLNAYYCAVNTDEDTCYMEYTGEHYINYTDPKVLAVLASAPYFHDIAVQDVGGGYMEASTQYTSTSGSSTGESSSHTLSIGAYVSFEHDFEVFGVKVASMEAEAAYTHGFTWETENTSTLEQSVSYGTDVGQDAVAFYSIPMEVYVYKSYHPVLINGAITYEEQLMTVNIPHTAAIATMSLEKYEAIAADYDDLPQISGNILKHEVGDPSTYPSSVADFASGLSNSANPEANAIVYNGDWAGVNFGGLGYIGQEIAMTSEKSKSFSNSDSIDTKIGAGVGDFKVGITAGYEYGYGSCTVTTSGSSFEGTIYNMPIEAEDYGYYYAWKLFAYMYNDGTNSFPIVDYLVTDVTTPPQLPNDFAQDTSRTTSTKNCLTWSYKDGAAGFQIYRYYEFPDGSGSYELGPIVKASDFEEYDESTNTKHYSYMDEGLAPYTDYDYQIQVIGGAQPTDSILSPVLTVRTKTDEGYPDIMLDKTNMLVYPDKNSSVTAYITNSELYTQGAKFQWQKLTDGIWTDVTGATKATFTLSQAGLSDEGEYRCRVNVIYDSYYISSYSKSVFVDYEKRNSTISDVQITEQAGLGPNLRVQVAHTYTDISSIPTGTVTFEIKSTNYEKSYTSEIGANGYAQVEATELPQGVYEIRASYSGSRVFKSASSNPAAYLSGSSEGYLLDISDNNVYGNVVDYDINKVTKTGNTTVLSPAGDSLTYKITKAVQTLTYKTYVIWGATITLPVWETIMEEQTGWVSGSTITAKQAGAFTLTAYENGVEVASKNFTIAKRNIIIDAKDKSATAKTSKAVHPTVLGDLIITQGSLALGDTIDNLGLYVKAVDTADKEVTIDITTDPGNYIITGAIATFNQTLANYNVEFTKGLYTLTGETFAVDGIAEELLGRDVGIVEVLSPLNHSYWSTEYQNGTQIIFTATPNTGYAISDWYIKDNATGNYIAQNNTSNKLIYTMKSEPLNIKVLFIVEGNTLTYKVKDDDANSTGSVVCTSADSLQSGAIVIENATYDFKAVPKEGYHFVEWQKYIYGIGTTYPEGLIDESGYHTISLTMGNRSTILYARFERDSYKLNLSENLEAWYMDNLDNDTSTPDEKVIVLSGTKIKGDKEVTVQPAPGFSIKSDAIWQKDGQIIENTTGVQSYKFNIVADTLIEAETINKPSKVEFNIQNAGGEENTVRIAVDDENVTDLEELNNIEGGSKLEFNAVPAYGYLFDKWIINGVEDVKSGKTLIIGTLGSDMTVVAVFKNNKDYAIDVSYSTEGEHGTLSYSLNGNSFVNVESPSQIKVFEGDNVTLRANVDSDFMVGRWMVNGTVYQTTAKAWKIETIDQDFNVWVEFVPMAYYKVEYSAGSGGDIAATMDGVSFNSGNNNIGGGTKVVFASTPGHGKMVDYWTINGETIKNEYGANYIGKSYTINGLSGDTVAEVFFKDIVEYTVNTITTRSAIQVTFNPSDQDDYTDVREGSACIFEIQPNNGFMLTEFGVTGNDGPSKFNSFDSVIENDDGSLTCIIYEITDNIEVYAVANKLYSISTDANAGGNVVISKDKAVEGEEITLAAYPSENYVFKGWKGTYIDKTSGSAIEGDINIDDENALSTKFAMPSGDVTVSAKFQYIPSIVYYNIITTPVTGGSVVISKNSAAQGEEITITAAANENYVFDVWKVTYITSIGGVDTTSEITLINPKAPIQTFQMVSADITVTAKFKYVAPNTPSNGGGGGAAVLLDEFLVEDIEIKGNLAFITLDDIKKTISQEANLELIELNKTLDLVFEGNGFKIVIPKSTLKIGDDLNKMIIPESSLSGDGWVVVYVDSMGNKKIVPWSVYSDNIIKFIASKGGKYEVINNLQSFNDILGHWGEDEINFITSRMLFMGTGDNNFSPDMSMSRAMLVTVLHRLDGLKKSAGESYNDVSEGQWYFDSVSWAVNNNLVSGYGEGVFAPDDSISREQLATILFRYAKYLGWDTKNEGNLGKFNDQDKISSYAIDSMKWAVDNNIITGLPGNLLNPDGKATRAEVSAIIMRFINLALK